VDRLDISALPMVTYGMLQANTTEVGGNTVITLPDGTITLSGLAATSLDETSFIGLVAAGAGPVPGTAGDDLFALGPGAQSMQGGAGNDSYAVDDAGDVVIEGLGEGIDIVESLVSYTLPENVENLTLTGLDAIDGTGNADANVIYGNGAANVLVGGGGLDKIYGEGGDDVLVGGDETNELRGGDGNDTIYGGAMWDTLIGDAGNDTIYGDGGNDFMRGGEGNDVLYGQDGRDMLYGEAGDDILDGGTNNDRMFGGAGNDTYYVDHALDLATEIPGEGIDTVVTSVNFTLGDNIENLTLSGSAAINGVGNALDNVMTGNSGDNSLDGGAGNDIIYGGAGADMLAGGAGADVFVYGDVADAGDTIADFTAGPGGDIVDLSQLLAELGYAGADAFADGWVRSVQGSGHTLVQVDANGGGDGFATVTTLQNVDETTLTVDNWLL
jgi:Ca2+-binding RTX toxin-like protein